MKFRLLFLSVLILAIYSCGSTKTTETKSNIQEENDARNRGQISLLTRIRQQPGIVLKNGVPVVNKASNTVSSFGNSEPLYVLNGQIIGNSFARIDQLIDNFNVKKIKVIAGPETSYYGTQGAKGVIEITTYQ